MRAIRVCLISMLLLTGAAAGIAMEGVASAAPVPAHSGGTAQAVMAHPAGLLAPKIAPQVTCGPKVSIVCNPDNASVCIRAHPNPAGNCYLLRSGTVGTGIYINCTVKAPTPKGPWGKDGIWDYITWSAQAGYTKWGYLNDNYVYTGANGPYRSQCPSPWPVGNP